MLKIYLDTCCYNRPYDDHSVARNALEAQAKAKIQSLIIKKHFLLVTSYFLLYENNKNPNLMRRINIRQFLKKYSSEYIGVEHIDSIRSKAFQIVQSGVKMADAIHIACALHAECDYFLSTDDRLLKYTANSMILLNPREFVRVEVKNNDYTYR